MALIETIFRFIKGILSKYHIILIHQQLSHQGNKTSINNTINCVILTHVTCLNTTFYCQVLYLDLLICFIVSM